MHRRTLIGIDPRPACRCDLPLIANRFNQSRGCQPFDSITKVIPDGGARDFGQALQDRQFVLGHSVYVPLPPAAVNCKPASKRYRPAPITGHPRPPGSLRPL